MTIKETIEQLCKTYPNGLPTKRQNIRLNNWRLISEYLTEEEIAERDYSMKRCVQLARRRSDVVKTRQMERKYYYEHPEFRERRKAYFREYMKTYYVKKKAEQIA